MYIHPPRIYVINDVGAERTFALLNANTWYIMVSSSVNSDDQFSKSTSPASSAPIHSTALSTTPLTTSWLATRSTSTNVLWKMDLVWSHECFPKLRDVSKYSTESVVQEVNFYDFWSWFYRNPPRPTVTSTSLIIAAFCLKTSLRSL